MSQSSSNVPVPQYDPETDKVLVTIEARDPLTEIKVLAGTSVAIPDGHGFGKVSVELRHGDYIFCMSAGNSIDDQLVRINKETPRQVCFQRENPLPFRATAPITSSIDFDPEQAKAARAWSLPDHPEEQLHDTSELFLFVRDVGSSLQLFKDSLSLWDVKTNKLVTTFGQPQFIDRSIDCLAYRLPLEPGPYLLRWRTSRWDRDQLLIAGRNYQTQIFLRCCERSSAEPGHEQAINVLPGKPAETEIHPDFASAALFAVRPGHGFDPADPGFRWSELTRLALEQGVEVPASALEAVVDAAEEHPILLLQAAYLYFRLGKSGFTRGIKVANYLARCFEDHPDLECLSIAYGRAPRAKKVLALPPMFAAGWQLLLETDLTSDLISPAGSLLCRMATAQKARIGPWLSWLPLPPQADVVKLTAFYGEDREAVVAAFSKWAQDARLDGIMAELPDLADRLTPYEHRLLEWSHTGHSSTTLADLVKYFRIPQDPMIQIILGLMLKVAEYWLEKQKKNERVNDKSAGVAASKVLSVGKLTSLLNGLQPWYSESARECIRGAAKASGSRPAPGPGRAARESKSGQPDKGSGAGTKKAAAAVAAPAKRRTEQVNPPGPGRASGPRLAPHQVIIAPLVTEKGTHQSTNERQNAYSFQVNLWANKTEIKRAVQELFGVRVLAVRTQLRLGKRRRYRFKMGRLSNWKKAIVKLHPEDKIEFF